MLGSHLPLKAESLRNLLRPEIFLLYYDQFKEIERSLLDNQIDECLKYLYLASTYEIFQGSFIPVGKEIDEIWHYLIIQTMDYGDFCKNLPGGKFIHHQSIHFTEFQKPRSREVVMETFLKWIAYYRHVFGPFTEESARCWVMVKFLTECFGYSLNRVNQEALSMAHSLGLLYDTKGLPASQRSSELLQINT